ncbi:MAG: hypothetical protein CMH76_10435 [Nitrospinae bacterium]|nr:hypothetical protein [Nitrospinota bacterium]
MIDWNSIYWPGGLPLWLIGILAIALAESMRRRIPFLREKLSPGRTCFLLALRGFLYLAILFFLSGPTVSEERTRSLPPRVLVLVDNSASMSVKDEPGGGSRLASVVDFLVGNRREKESENATPKGFLGRLSGAYDVQVRRFDIASVPLSREEIGYLEPVGQGSDALGVIRSAMKGRAVRPGGEDQAPALSRDRPEAIILLSDGGDTSGSIWPPENVDRFPPVLTFGIGSSRRFQDISIHDVRAPRLAFQKKEVHLEATLTVRGYVGQKLPIALTRDGRVVSTQALDIRRDPTRKKIRFRFTPRDVGSLLLSLETPLQRGEMVESNNRVEVPLEVRRNKIRMLTISGAPSWNYRFFRMALKRDPSIDLVSFVFLRTSEDDPGVPTRQLSLVPFPVDTLFREELKNFDIVVFDNFSANAYFSNYYLQRVYDYVKGGGGFLMFGGKNSFSSGGYVLSPIEKMLPVDLVRGEDFFSGVKFRGKLTISGNRHPITLLSPDPKTNERLWSKFPPLRQGNLTTRGAEGTILLSSKEGPTMDRPMIAVRRVGEGRVLSILTDDLWRWNYGMVAAEKTNRLYLRLVAQMVRWLSGDPSASQVEILPEAEPGKDGAYVIRLQVRDESFAPASGAKVQLSLRDPYGMTHRVRAVFLPETGEFEARFKPRGRGSYRAEVQAMLGERSLGHSIRTVSVGDAAGGAEWADASPNWERLRDLSRETGGIFIPVNLGENEENSTADRVMEALKGKVPPKLVEVRDVRLWSIPWIGFILILLPAVEWTTRRLWGLA